MPSLDHLPVLTTSRLTLRPLTYADAPAVYEAVRDSHDLFFLWFPWADDYSLAKAEDNLRRAEEANALGAAWHYGLINRFGDLVGRVSIDTINRDTLSGELGYWMRQDHERQGLMTEALHTLLAYAFGPGGLHRVYAYTDTDNIASQRVLTKVGFRLEGTHCHIARHWSRGWRDQHCYALLAGE